MKPCSLLHKTCSLLLAFEMLIGPTLGSIAAPLRSTDAAPPQIESAIDPEPVVHVNKTIPTVQPPSAAINFGSAPTDEEISNANVFFSVLRPIHAEVKPQENRDLAAALVAFSTRVRSDDFSTLEFFVQTHRNSRWTPSLNVQLGYLYRRHGYLSRALAAFQSAWGDLRNAGDDLKPTADFALGNLADLYRRFGMLNELDGLLAQFESNPRTVGGAATEHISAARAGLAMMKHDPAHAFLCGPNALLRLKSVLTNSASASLAMDAGSFTNGTSLRDLQSLATNAGLAFRAAERHANAEIIVPSIVHWKVGHFAAVTAERNGLYLIQDAVIGNELWITPEALDDESSGFFLAPDKDLPPGWTWLNDEKAASVRGKGSTTEFESDAVREYDQKTGGNEDCDGDEEPGMAKYSFHAMTVSLNIVDVPLRYRPPVGPAVALKLTYNEREQAQPPIIPFTNFGDKWACNWVSYITEGANPTCYLPGGGQETYFQDVTTPNLYYPDKQMSGCKLTKTQVDDPRDQVTTLRDAYLRDFRDGTKIVYIDQDASRRWFQSVSYDSAGNMLQFQYDSSFRLKSITDAIGQVTTLQYSGETKQPLSVTDPFGRTASFTYSGNNLISITDMIGLVSQFTYAGANDPNGNASFITALGTPYGATQFLHVQTTEPDPNGSGIVPVRILQATDSAGETERVEFHSSVNDSVIPAYIPDRNGPYTSFVNNDAKNYLSYRNTFYWTKRAWKQEQLYAPLRYDYAHIYHWLHANLQGASTAVASSILESEKPAGENRIWYFYPPRGSGGANPPTSFPGTPLSQFRGRPTSSSRQLNNGSSLPAATYATQATYDQIGNLITFGDGTASLLTRGTQLTYHLLNGVPTVNVHEVQRVIGDITTPNYTTETLARFESYVSPGRPQSVFDGAGRQTQFAYNARGQIDTVTNPKNEVIHYVYDLDGHLMHEEIPATQTQPRRILNKYTYDPYSRIRSVTDLTGYTLVYSYDTFDRVTKIAHPDGTFEQIKYDRLDAEWLKDRWNRWTRIFYNKDRNPVKVIEPMGLTTTFDWCSCGSLESITDPGGRTTVFTYDNFGRLVKKDKGGATVATSYTYTPETGQISTVTDFVKGSEDSSGNPTKFRQRQYGYNEFNIPVQITFSASDGTGAPAVPAAPGITFSYNPTYDRMDGVTYGTAFTEFGYYAVNDSKGPNLLSYVKEPVFQSTRIGYEYDELGRLKNSGIQTSTFNPPNYIWSPLPTALQYDDLGRMTQVANPLGTFTYTYNGYSSQIQSVSLVNSLQQTFNYNVPNAGGLLRQIVNNYNPAGGSTLVSQFDYTYLQNRVENWTKQQSTLASDAKTTSHRYVQDRLVSAITRRSGAVLQQFSYTYDNSGNRLTDQKDSSVRTFTFDFVNRISSVNPGGRVWFEGHLTEPADVTLANLTTASAPERASMTNNLFYGTAPVAAGVNTVQIKATDAGNNITTLNKSFSVASFSPPIFRYDDYGNLLEDEKNIYTWNAAGQLATVKIKADNSVTYFAYDAFGRCVQASAATIKYYLWDGLALVQRSNASATERKYYPQGFIENTPFGTQQSYLYTFDHQGSVRELVRPNDGVVAARYDYDPYGLQSPNQITGGNAVESDYGFAGLLYRANLKLYFGSFRAYDPMAGRWLNPDPIGESGGLNLFSYCDGDPIDFNDSMGLMSWREFNPLLILDLEAWGNLIHSGAVGDSGPSLDPNSNIALRNSLGVGVSDLSDGNGNALRGSQVAALVGGAVVVGIINAATDGIGAESQEAKVCVAKKGRLRDALGRFLPTGKPRSPSFDTARARHAWERAKNRPWPVDPRNNEPFIVHHIERRADGGALYDPANILPVHPDMHPRIHAPNGPSPNWP